MHEHMSESNVAIWVRNQYSSVRAWYDHGPGAGGDDPGPRFESNIKLFSLSQRDTNIYASDVLETA